MVRTAFLIGNKTYARKGKCVIWWKDIPTAFHDVDVARDILEDCGFECATPMKDATSAELRALPLRTAGSLRDTHSPLCLWLYSGHGVTYAGRLYLIPSDFQMKLPAKPVWSFFASPVAMLAFWLYTTHGRELCQWYLFWTALATFCLLEWMAVAQWALKVCWQILTWHPLADSVCFDDLEAQLANIHETHRASRAAFVFVLDCCREHRHFGRWHRLLLCWQGVGSAAPQCRASSKSTRPNFFTVFACEQGRAAFYKQCSHGFLVSALIETLRDRERRCITLHYMSKESVVA